MQRTHPFGYTVVNGAITINETEKPILIEIFTRYADGESYLKIAEGIERLGVTYHEGKNKWNKNMIARILENSKYLGTDKFPRIIDDELFEKTSRKKSEKPDSTTKETAEIKGIKTLLTCKECGGRIHKRKNNNQMDRWYCENNPHHISTQVKTDSIIRELKTSLKNFKITENAYNQPSDTEDIKRLHSETSKLLSQGKCDENFIKLMIIDIAQKRYQNSQSHIGDYHYQNSLLQKILDDEEIDAKKLTQIILQIQMDFNGKLTLIGRRE